MVEAVKLALADRDAFVTDPNEMAVPAELLLDPGRVTARFDSFDPTTARSPRPGPGASGGTAYMCAADWDGMLVSLIQSNWLGFGSGLTVPGWGINLHNRGSFFSLDPAASNVIAPRKRTLHTLIPAMALRADRPWLVFGTMGGNGQPQTHLQVLVHIIDDGWDIQRAIDAPRWVVSPSDWSVAMESRVDASVVEGLRARGHPVALTGAYDSLMGHAHAIQILDGGYAAASDPRSEGATVGL